MQLSIRIVYYSQEALKDSIITTLEKFNTLEAKEAGGVHVEVGNPLDITVERGMFTKVDKLANTAIQSKLGRF